MTASVSTSLNPGADSAVLLVLLPAVATDSDARIRNDTIDKLGALQQQLASTVRLLKIDEDTHPLVVRSFQAEPLPTFILVQQGVEVWREQIMFEDELFPAFLLQKLNAIDNIPRVLNK